MKRLIVLAATLGLAACGGDPVPARSAGPTAAPVAPAPVVPATWNMEDPDAMTSGNLLLAARMISRGDELPEADITVAAALKAPWNHYGKRVCFNVVVGRAEELPPGSDFARAVGGSVGEVIGLAKGETIIDMIAIGGTGDLAPEQRTRLCGLIAGRTEVPNAVGGDFTHLMMVGRL